MMSHVKKLLNEFINSEILIDYCNHVLENLKSGIIDRSPKTIYESKTFKISLVYVDLSEQKLLPTNVNEKYIAVISGEMDYSYRLYRLDGVEDSRILDKNKKLILEEENILRKNEILHIQPFVHVLQHTSNFKGILLTAESKVFQDFVWYFNMENLAPVSYNFTDRHHKRLEGTVELLNAIGDKNSIAPLYKLSFHENHTIRWKSLQKLINLDYEKGIEVLKHMAAQDQHIEIRVAAQRTLERILK